MITFLHLVSLAMGLGATLIGYTTETKWKNNRFTKKGVLLAVLVTLTAAAQTGVHLTKSAEMERIRSAMNRAYAGWIKIGNYSSDRWVKKFIITNDDPIDIKPRDILFTGTADTYYITVRDSHPGACSPSREDRWWKETAMNVLPRHTEIRIMKVETFSCPNGLTEVWAEVRPHFR